MEQIDVFAKEVLGDDWKEKLIIQEDEQDALQTQKSMRMLKTQSTMLESAFDCLDDLAI